MKGQTSHVESEKSKKRQKPKQNRNEKRLRNAEKNTNANSTEMVINKLHHIHIKLANMAMSRLLLGMELPTKNEKLKSIGIMQKVVSRRGTPIGIKFIMSLRAQSGCKKQER